MVPDRKLKEECAEILTKADASLDEIEKKLATFESKDERSQGSDTRQGQCHGQQMEKIYRNRKIQFIAVLLQSLQRYESQSKRMPKQ